MNANRIRGVLLVTVSVWFSVVAQAQIRERDTRDYRAALNIVGRITEISVAPDEQIWLTTYMGESIIQTASTPTGIMAAWTLQPKMTRRII